MAHQQHLIEQLLDRTTDKRLRDPDPDALRRLKQVCKSGGDAAVKSAFDTWFERLKDNHARVRLLALKLADELFSRSSMFRTLVSSNFSDVAELTVGYKASRPLPSPQREAVQLRELALDSIERWKEQYGHLYPQISMGYTYLKDVMNLQFPELRARAAAREAEAAARQERTRRICEEKYAVIKQDYVSVLSEVEVAVDEMVRAQASTSPVGEDTGGTVHRPLSAQEAAFRLLEGVPEPLPAAEQDEEWEDVQPEPDARSEVDRQPAEGAPSLTAAAATAKPVVRNPDSAVLDSLRGAYKLVVNRHLPAVLEWLRVAVKVDVGQPGSLEHGRRERVLRAAIGARDRMLQARSHCDALMAELRENSAGSAEPGRPPVTNVYAAENTAPRADRLPDGTTAAQFAQAAALRSASNTTASTSAGDAGNKATLLTDIFGSDSDEDGHQSPPESSRRSANHLPQSSRPTTAAHMFDPTYRRPTAAARSESALLPSSTAPPPADDISRSKLPANLKLKLLSEAPALPAGNHLAYWDSDKASLLNNKGMEVYNHWGAVDEHVALPDHVISQFFTTRATYYEPQKAAPPQKRSEAPVAGDSDSPPRKRPAPVTAIGFGGVTNSSLAARLKPAVMSRRNAPTTASLLSTAGGGATAGAAEPAQATEVRGVPGRQENAREGVEARDVSTPPAPVSPKELSTSAAAKERGGRAVASCGRGLRGGRSRATQRALDSAHNEAVLGEATGSDEALARNLAEQELQAVNEGAAGRNKKDRPSVRQRLAKKLLNSSATSKAVRDLDAVESEQFRERESRRW